MGKISVVINTLNEEKNLARALKSVATWAYEVVVVDMNSDDKTQEIAKKFKTKFFTHKRTGYVEPARNFAISKATGDWILILDADEEIPSSLARKLMELVALNEADYYALPRKNIVFGKWMKHSRWWPDYNLRFFKKGKVVWDDKIHSLPITQGVGLDILDKPEFAIVHHNYNSVEQYILRLNRYTSIQAAQLYENGKKPNWKSFIKKPSDEFLSRFFAGKGYRDGIHGLSLALLQSFSELVVYVKLWEHYKFAEREIDINQIKQELNEAQKDVNYWIADSLVNESGGAINRLKRKLKLP